jgi:hypothetical protein
VLRVAFPLGPWQGYRKVRAAIPDLQGRHPLGHLRRGLALAPVLPAMGHVVVSSRRPLTIAAQYGHIAGATTDSAVEAAAST